MFTTLKPHKIFLWIAGVFGFLMIVVTPPFQPQDEPAHFYRAYQVSTGVFSSVKQNQRLGGYIPESLTKLYSEFLHFNCTYTRISPYELWQTQKIDLAPNDTIFIDFTNTALYSAILYLPQAIGIFAGKQFEAGPFWLIYIGRLLNLIVFIILVYMAVKIMPFKKWLLVILALLPLSLTVASSLSADVLVNSLSFLTIAIILKFAFNDTISELSWKHFFVILILSVLIGLAKLVYVPILFLMLLIPVSKFKNYKVKFGVLFLAIFVGLGTAFIQKSNIDSKYIPYSEYNAKYRDYTALNKGCDINKQIDFIKENPKYTAKVFSSSFFREFKHLAQGYVGLFGYGHVYPPVWYVLLFYLIILFYLIFDFSSFPNLTFFQRGLFGLITIVLLFLIMLSQYLSWDLVGENRAYPLIGRYFIPVFPLFLIMLFNVIKINQSVFIKQNTIIAGVFAFCLFSGVISIYLVLDNSYTLNKYSHSKWNISYSFKENLNDNGSIQYIINNKDTIAAFYKPAGFYVTNEKVFTGSRSLKLFENNPYGFTIKIFKGKAKDKVIASFRNYGLGGFLDFQEFPNGINYWTSRKYPEKDSLGWKYQEAQFILPHNIEKNHELRIFVWWPGSDSIYIDDYKVTYYENNKTGLNQ